MVIGTEQPNGVFKQTNSLSGAMGRQCGGGGMPIGGVNMMPGLPPDEDDRAQFGNSDKENGKAKSPTILIVEDEALVRISMAEEFRDSGFRVLEACNAEEALQIFGASEPIELMISDVNMPGMDGVALAIWVQSNFPDVRIVMVSGAASNRTAITGVVFIEKPFALDNIVRIVRSLIKR
jgi:CheY-like chemotaxis protein